MFLSDNDFNILSHFTKKKEKKCVQFRNLNKYKSLDGEIKFMLR